MTDSPDFDVLVIGAGPGGYVAAIRAAQNGARVGLVEKELLGGTCLNWGCIPTKTLIASSEVFETCAHAAAFGVVLEAEPFPDWSAMVARKNKISGELRKGIGSLMKANKIEVLPGTGRLVGRDRVRIESQVTEPREVTAGAIILATGSEPVRPSFVPDSPRVLYSREALDMPELPADILILGGGVIGCEFASLFARLGVDVTLVEMLPGILTGADTEIAKTVRREMKKRGITIITGAPLEAIHEVEDGIAGKAGDKELVAEKLLVCVGRRPLTRALGLADIGIETTETGHIPVNGKCRTRVPGIYAIGDLCAGPQLAHRASAMGVCAADNATGHAVEFDEGLVPACVFTAPETAGVGLTEEQAVDQGLEVAVGRFPFMALGKAKAIGETAGFVKIVADSATDQVVGVHIVGPHAGDLIAEAAAAMRLEVTAEELAATIHVHPTLPEAMMEAAHDVAGKCIHMPPRR